MRLPPGIDIIRIRRPYTRHRRGERPHDFMWTISVMRSFGDNRYMLLGMVEADTLKSALRRFRFAQRMGWLE